MPSSSKVDLTNSESDRRSPNSLSYQEYDPLSKSLLTRGRYSIIKIAFIVLLAIVFLTVGILIGYFGIGQRLQSKDQKHQSDYSYEFSQKMQSDVNATALSERLREITSYDHIATSSNRFKLINDIAERWKNFGLDNVIVDNYTVQLSAKAGNSTVQLINKNGSLNYDATSANAVYNAYSPNNSTIKGAYIFVHYATVQDFEKLAELNINCSGLIAVAALGRGFRGGKAGNAAKCGAKALLLYPDPRDFTAHNESVYPDSWWLPDDVGVYGNVRVKGPSGDPRTPGLPSNDGIFVFDASNKGIYPTIPVHSIGYKDAKYLFQQLNGTKVPDEWRGMLSEFIGPSNTVDLSMSVTTTLDVVPISNIIGIVKGAVEPDRYVVLGNHFDAWGPGGSDPGSGSVIMDQVASIFGKFLKSGYRPRRSLIIGTWDAEEFGLVGSTEFIERLPLEIASSTISHLNVDAPIKGLYSFSVNLSPGIQESVKQATKSVVLNTTATLYDDWLAKKPKDPNDPSKGPIIGIIGGGSDHVNFVHKLGIPAAYPTYTYKESLPNMPTYHTIYDNFEVINNFVDPGFSHTALVTKFSIDFLLRSLDSYILPYNVSEFTSTLLHGYSQLNRSMFEAQNIYLNYLDQSIQDFRDAEVKFSRRLASITPAIDDLSLRHINDALQKLPRVFLWFEGLPLTPDYKNILFSPDYYNSYTSAIFPGLQQAWIVDNNNETNYYAVKFHLSLLINAIRQATNIISGGLIGWSD